MECIPTWRGHPDILIHEGGVVLPLLVSAFIVAVCLVLCIFLHLMVTDSHFQKAGWSWRLTRESMLEQFKRMGTGKNVFYCRRQKTPKLTWKRKGLYEATNETPWINFCQTYFYSFTGITLVARSDLATPFAFMLIIFFTSIRHRTQGFWSGSALFLEAWSGYLCISVKSWIRIHIKVQIQELSRL
jgi:hypothetical protein